MAGAMSRGKGARGEREAKALVLGWAEPVYRHAGVEPPTLERNLMQSRSGGFDLVGIPWLALEVKRQENPQLPAWWRQTVRQSGEGQVPFLMWRGNRQSWRFRVLVNCAHGAPHCGQWGITALPVDMDSEAAKAWFQAEVWWRLGYE